MVVYHDRQHNGQNMEVKYFSSMHVINVDVLGNYVKSQPTSQKHIPRHRYETIYTSNGIIYALYNITETKTLEYYVQNGISVSSYCRYVSVFINLQIATS